MLGIDRKSIGNGRGHVARSLHPHHRGTNLTLKNIRGILSLSLGVIGLGGCIAAIVATWVFSARLVAITNEVAETTQSSIEKVEQQVTLARERVAALRLTTEEVGQALEEWGQDAVKQRIRSKVDVEAAADRVVDGLGQADQWLEIAESSGELVKNVLEMAATLNVPVDSEAIDRLLQETAELRGDLNGLVEPAEAIRDRAAKLGKNDEGDTKIKQIIQTVTRVVTTFGSIDSRLETLAQRLSALRTSAEETRQSMNTWVRLAAIAVSFLFAWMAAGQAALCYLGWTSLRNPNSSSTP